MKNCFSSKGFFLLRPAGHLFKLSIQIYKSNATVTRQWFKMNALYHILHGPACSCMKATYYVIRVDPRQKNVLSLINNVYKYVFSSIIFKGYHLNNRLLFYQLQQKLHLKSKKCIHKTYFF